MTTPEVAAYEPIVKVEMLIRKPVAEVFQAFIDPEVTTKFWFTKSSGKLEPGAHVRWDWEMYGVSTNVRVLEMEHNRRILIEWEESYGYTSVEWTFIARSNSETFVTIVNKGIEGDDIINQMLDLTEGFTIVLCGLKALLEHNIELNLVADKAPDAHVKN